MCTQDLLGHCLELFQENQARINALEAHLIQYGYKPQPGFTAVLDPLQLVDAVGKLTKRMKPLLMTFNSIYTLLQFLLQMAS